MKLAGVEAILCLGRPGTPFLYRPEQFNIKNSQIGGRLTCRFYWANRRGTADA
jgi:hypothetical protein